jgi:hypothetical protein
MTSQLHSTAKTATSQLRDRIIGAYQRAQRIITAASSAANPHATMVAYDKASDHLRADIVRASNLFPDTDALLSWLLDDLPDDAFPEQDRTSLALIVRTMRQDAEEQRKAS